MSGNSNGGQPPATSAALETLKGWALPVVVASLTGLMAWMMKIDDRLYEFQGTVVTEQQLDKVETRITERMDRIDKKLDQLLQQSK